MSGSIDIVDDSAAGNGSSTVGSTNGDTGRGTPCTLQSRAVFEPMAGTAPTARAWIVLEHPGPWGRYAVADSDLPEPVRAHLERATQRQITVLLARRPDRRAGSAPGASPNRSRVWIARCGAGGARLRTGTIEDYHETLTWDLDAIADGSLPALDRVDPAPLVLVCTNGRRDACCAVHGRALLAGIAERATPDQWTRVWECTHLGGHRFAPTLVSLPDGMVHGRVSIDDALALLGRLPQGRILPSLLRGRSCLPPPLQAAEVAARCALDADEIDALDALAIIHGRAVPVPGNWPAPTDDVRVEIRHRDGRAWHVDVTRVAPVSGTGERVVRSESCGAVAKPLASWVASEPVATASWH